MSQTPYFALLTALARRLGGIDPTAFNASQSLIVAGRRIDFTLEPDPYDDNENRLVLRCEVAKLPSPASEDVCRLMLRANNLWAGTLGATLGLRGDRCVLMSETARLNSLDADSLVNLISNLRDQAELWSREVVIQHEQYTPYYPRA